MTKECFNCDQAFQVGTPESREEFCSEECRLEFLEVMEVEAQSANELGLNTHADDESKLLAGALKEVRAGGFNIKVLTKDTEGRKE